MRERVGSMSRCHFGNCITSLGLLAYCIAWQYIGNGCEFGMAFGKLVLEICLD